MEPVGRPVRLAERDRRDEHLATIKEFNRVDYQITDGPLLVVQEKIFHTANVTIGGTHRESFEIFQAS